MPDPQRSPTVVRWTERFPVAQLPLAGELFVALAAAVVATAIRLLLDPVLPPGYPFLTYFPVVIVCAFLLGLRTGLLTALFCGLASWHFFMPTGPGHPLSRNTAIALCFYAFITATEIALVHWMQRSNRALLAERETNARMATTRELLFRELQHRVSNNLQVVAALLTIQRRQIADPDAKMALDEASRRLSIIGRISRHLYDPNGSGQQLGPFLQQLASDVIETSGRKDVHCTVAEGSGRQMSPEAAVPVALIVAEAVANALEHGFDQRAGGCVLEIRVVSLDARWIAVEIEDNGSGLPEGFRLEGSNSLGLKIATMLAAQLGGRFELLPAPSGGALARLEMPAEA